MGEGEREREKEKRKINGHKWREREPDCVRGRASYIKLFTFCFAHELQ